MDILRSGLARCVDALSASPTDHLSVEDLFNYSAGKPCPDSEDQFRDHIVLCDRCRCEFLKLDAWLRSIGEPDQSDMQVDENLEWDRLRCWFFGERGHSSARPLRTDPLRWYAAAALLLTCLGFYTGLGLRSGTERPIINPQVVELMPESMALTRGPHSAKQLSSSSFWTLVVAVPPIRVAGDPQAIATLLDDSERRIWRDEVEAGDAGYVLVLPRRLIPPGRYRLVLSWQERGDAEEYEFEVAESERARPEGLLAPGRAR